MFTKRLLPVAALLALLACSAPPQSAAPRSTDPTAAPTTSLAASSPAPAGSPAAAEPAGVTSDAEAIRELQATREGYTRAQQALQAGRRDEALELMNAAYVEHFERIEPYLDQRFSRDYREEVEASISRNLRRRLRDGAPDAEVLTQFPAAFQRLDEAEQRLSGR
jgi:hypothetical protein